MTAAAPAAQAQGAEPRGDIGLRAGRSCTSSARAPVLLLGGDSRLPSQRLIHVIICSRGIIRLCHKAPQLAETVNSVPGLFQR